MLAKVTRILKSTAFRKGVVGTSRGWLGLWVAATLAQRLRKLAAREERVVERIVLKPGQRVEIVETGVPREELTDA